MSTTRKTPKLRFPEFTDDWEQRKLSDISERVTRKNKNLEYSLPLTISAQYGLVDQHEFFNKRIAAKDVSGYYVIKNGEFAYNKSYSEGYPWGAVKRLDRYENGVLSTLYILFSVKNVDSDFLVSYYDTNNWHSEVQQRSAEGARNHGLLNISASDFFDTELVIPQDPNEQKKIGLLFKKLDSTITLHQRELDSLKKLKKSLLQKMFPKNGEKIPELRFPEFTGDWEQRKLSDYLFTSKEKNVNNKYGRKDVYSVSGEFGVVNQIEFQGRSFAGKTLDGYDVIHKGEVVYTKSPLKSNPYGIIKTNKRETGIVSTLYAVYKPKDTCFANFVEDYFNSDSRTNRYLSPLISKGAKNTINVSDDKALDGIVIFPSTEEQRKISTYFEKLNNLITLHQRELDTLKKLKKGLLQNMFV